jgi:hypothetical protein
MRGNHHAEREDFKTLRDGRWCSAARQSTIPHGRCEFAPPDKTRRISLLITTKEGGISWFCAKIANLRQLSPQGRDDFHQRLNQMGLR